jgi:hypothetical protein
MNHPTSTPSTTHVVSSVSYDSETDDDAMASMMGLLDAPYVFELDIYSTRDQLPQTLQLGDFHMFENAACNFRDGTVLGKPPRIVIPTELRQFDTLLLSIYLHTDYDTTDPALRRSCSVKAPIFCSENMKTTHGEIQHTHPVKPHQLWVNTNTLGVDFSVRFKKKPWELSRKFRKVTSTQWPTFIIVATPAIDGILQPEKSIRTIAFQVRSKEQVNRTSAARGLSGPVVTKKRRTPQSEAAMRKLQKSQSDIVQIRNEILKLEQHNKEYETRFRFMMAIADTDPRFKQISTLMANSVAQIRAMGIQRNNKL